MSKMKIIAINGSPRKGWNTHMLCQKALDGAADVGAETELVNLYDIDFKGCISCFECKRTGGRNVGRCAVNDDLKPLLERISTCDGLIIASPIYINEVTASTRAFIERLTFQYVTYSMGNPSFYKGKLPVALIFTMNVGADALDRIGYTDRFEGYEQRFERIFDAPCHSLVVTETLQTDDYSKYHMTMFNEADRKKRREEVFPKDCERSFEIGKMLARYRG
jgi:multimeric flavodoxin WrbA